VESVRGRPLPLATALLMSQQNCQKLPAMSSKALCSFVGMVVSFAMVELTSGSSVKLK
jgi:hypothetical protein